MQKMEKKYPIIPEEKQEKMVSQKPSDKSITRSMLSTMSNAPVDQ